MRIKSLLVLLLIWTGLTDLCGQTPQGFFDDYSFHFITEEAGLPHNYVDDIYKDSQGYIWAATYNGVGRYNGYRFVHYNSSTSPIRLKSDFVHQVCEDSFRRLWVGSEGGLDLIDLEHYLPASLDIGPHPELEPLMNSYITAVYRDGQDDMWVSTDSSLWCLELAEDGGVEDWYRLEENVESPVYAVADLDWCICAGIGNNVYRVRKAADNRLKVELLSDMLTPFTEDWRIHCMETDGDLLWIGTNRGLFKYNHRQRTLERYRYSNHRPGMLSQAYITDVKRTESGRIIVSTLNGLNVYNPESDTFSYIRQNNDSPDKSLNCNFINCLLVDGESIWAGTEIGGVNLLTPNCLKTRVWQYSYLRETSLSPNPVNAIGEDRQGNLWVGTVEGGLNRKSAGSDEFVHYTFDRNDETSISHNSIRGILIDSENHLWAYTWGVGINELDLNIPDNRAFNRHIREDLLGLEGDFLSCACEDTVNNGIWFGTTRGLHFYNKEDRRFTRVLFECSDNEFEGGGTIFIDRQHRLWFGTMEGVFVMDLATFSIDSPETFEYTYMKHKLTDPDSFELEKINCIIEDNEGTIWLGANGNGLYRLIEDEDGVFRFRNYTDEDGLPNNTIVGMIEDKQGNLWMSTNYGISRLDTRTMGFTNYTKEDGLPTNQFYLNACYYSSRNDLLYFGTINGLVAFSPDVVSREETRTEVFLTSFSVDGTVVYPPMNEGDDKYLVDERRLNLHDRDRRFSIEYSTLNYGNCNRARYAYRLNGYESEWIEAPAGEYVASYHNVPFGRYTFQVRATDEQGHWSDKVTEMTVEIEPYFYKTWWFFILMFMLIGGGGNHFYRWKTRRYRQQKMRLESEVAKRTQELENQNRRLEVMARHVEEATEEKIAFFTNITHEFRTPVTLINGPLKKAMRESEEPAVKQQLQIAERNSNYLLSLVNEMMDFGKLDADRVVLEKKSTDFARFIKDILLPFEVLAAERDIHIRIYFRLKTPYWVFDAEYMRKVVVNLLSNAVKFTPNHGLISVYVGSFTNRDDNDLLFLDIKDTGSGIVPEEFPRIFERFYQSKNVTRYPTQGQSSTGIGLFLCKRIVSLHGGDIYAGNNPGSGAYFRVLLPLERGSAENIQDDAIVSEQPAGMEEKGMETVLVVEDNDDMRTYINSILCKDYRVLAVRHGAEALELLSKKDVDLIVSDLMMPVMDGNELSKRVKSDLAISHIPFLMLTAVRSDVQEKMSYEIGVDEYLCKPFDEDIFQLRIRNILSQRRKYREKFSSTMDYGALNISSASKDDDFMKAAIGLMKKNYSHSEYTLESFVRDMGYSKTMINQKFHSLTGQSIGQFMKSYRLNVARNTFISSGGQVSVSDVAYAVGFNDPKYFTKCFKDLFGCLPSEFVEKK